MARRVATGLGCILLAMVLLGAGYMTYARPQTDALRAADAIIVLGGPSWDRFPFAIRLAESGIAPALVISTAIGPKDPGLWDYCHKPNPKRSFDLYCFTPNPPTTQGEAEELGRLAKRYHWNKVIAVTFRPHISRARFVLQRCFPGKLLMVESPAQISAMDWVYQYAYQTLGYLRALVSSRDC